MSFYFIKLFKGEITTKYTMKCKEQHDLQILYYDHDFEDKKFSIQMCRCCFLKPQVILSLDEYESIDPIDYIESLDNSRKEFVPTWEGHCDLKCNLNS